MCYFGQVEATRRQKWQVLKKQIRQDLCPQTEVEAMGIFSIVGTSTLVTGRGVNASTRPFLAANNKNCSTCKGKGALECKGCKGSGKNKKNGNLFERWKCFDCQGFGLVSCPSCGKGGLTPEQRGER